MFGTIFIVSLIFLAGTSYGEKEKGNGERCTCNMVHHVQEHFCLSDFALHVRVLGVETSPLPGETDYGMVHNLYVRYGVEVIENFKDDEFEKGQIITVYSPRRGICGRTDLFDPLDEDATNEYLFVGDIGTSNGEEVKLITNCNWVQPWEELKESQIDGLRGVYSLDCSCQADPVSGPMDNAATDAEKFSYANCFFNPVKANILKVSDCETLYGFCLRQKNGECRWENTEEFHECYETRRNGLTAQAAAVTTKEGCKMYSGRKKKQCLLKFLKGRHGNK